MIVEISVTLLCTSMYGKNFQTYGVNIPRKYIDSRHFYSCPCSCHHALGRRKLLIPLGSILSKICFPKQEKGVEETMVCQNSVRKYEDNLEH